MSYPPTSDGLLLVDKPSGLTSHDVVARIRKLAHTKKVGHGGTLDPMATGVLVVALGAATRLLTWISGHNKTYEATIRLGATTSTEDAEGTLTGTRGCHGLPVDRLDAAMRTLTGDILQVPSAVSAIKVDGKRAYARVRAGEDVHLPARPVTIVDFRRTGRPRETSIPVDGTDVPVTDVDAVVQCSTGTYVRALARDLGQALGCGAHLTALRRTQLGTFDVAQAYTLDALQERVDSAVALPVIDLSDAAQAMFPQIALNATEVRLFANGQAPRRAVDQLPGTGPFALMDSHHVMGLARVLDGHLKTILVFHRANKE